MWKLTLEFSPILFPDDAPNPQLALPTSVFHIADRDAAVVRELAELFAAELRDALYMQRTVFTASNANAGGAS